MSNLRVLRPPLAALACFALAAMLTTPGTAKADVAVYGFSQLPGGTSSPAPSIDTSPYYKVSLLSTGESYNFGGTTGVKTVGTGQVLFLFQNSGDASITDIYFQDGTLFDISTVYNTPGVSLIQDQLQNQAPGNLPRGTELEPDFLVSSIGTGKNKYSLGVGTNGNQDGVDYLNEAVGVVFTLKTDTITGNPFSFDKVKAAIDLGVTNPSAAWNPNGTGKTGLSTPLGLRIGIHVQSIGAIGGGSDSFVNTNGPPVVPTPTTPTPEPGTILGALLSLIPVGLIVRRHRGN